MSLSPRPTPPVVDPTSADTQTLVDAGVLPEQPTPSTDPPVDEFAGTDDVDQALDAPLT